MLSDRMCRLLLGAEHPYVPANMTVPTAFVWFSLMGSNIYLVSYIQILLNSLIDEVAFESCRLFCSVNSVMTVVNSALLFMPSFNS